MNAVTNGVLLICLLNLQLISCSFGYNDPIFNRSKENSQVEKSNADPNISCSKLLLRCRMEDECIRAVGSIKEKCVTRSGSCNADVRDLNECGFILDTLENNGFVMDKKCDCNKGENCSTVYKVIFNNPCFSHNPPSKRKHHKVTLTRAQQASVSYLRRMNAMPNVEPLDATFSTDPGYDASTSYDVIDDLLSLLSTENHVIRNPMMSSKQNSIEVMMTSRTINVVATTMENRNTNFVNEVVTILKNKEVSAKTELTSTLLYVIALTAGFAAVVVVVIGCGLIRCLRIERRKREIDC